MQQMSLTFQPGLGSRNRTLREHMATQIYQKGLVAVAGRIDTSPSKLTEKLAGMSSDGKPRDMTVSEMEAYIVACDDLSPIYYLIDKYLRDPEVRRDEAIATITQFMDIAPGLLEALGAKTSARKR